MEAGKLRSRCWYFWGPVGSCFLTGRSQLLTVPRLAESAERKQASFPGTLLIEALLPLWGPTPWLNSRPKAPPPNTTTREGKTSAHPLWKDTGIQSTALGEMSQRLWGFREGCWCSWNGSGHGGRGHTHRRRTALRERAVTLSDVCPYCGELFPNGDHLLTLYNPQLFALRLLGIYLVLSTFVERTFLFFPAMGSKRTWKKVTYLSIPAFPQPLKLSASVEPVPTWSIAQEIYCRPCLWSSPALNFRVRFSPAVLPRAGLFTPCPLSPGRLNCVLLHLMLSLHLSQ